MKAGVLIVAKQRSGTNYLRSVLSSGQGIRDLGEVFQPRSRNLQVNANPKYEEWLRHTGNNVGISYDESVQHAERYLKELVDKYGVVCLDVKYNSCLRVIGTWYSAAEIPPIIAAAIRCNFLVVHLERLNRLEHAVSTAVAEKTGNYVVPVGADVIRTVYELDIHGLFWIADQYDREVKIVRHWLGLAAERFSRVNILELTYESFSNCNLVELERLVDTIYEICGVTRKGPVQSFVQKLIPDWRSQVSNWMEVERHFKSRTGKSLL